jgi:regulatory protein YycH of two-component signal transduction system YycFG
MKERAKTIMLVFLVAVSFILTNVWWFYQPRVENYRDPAYAYRTKIAPELDTQDVLRPEKVVFHYGEQKPAVGLPDSPFFKVVVDGITHWSFSRPEEVQYAAVNWAELMNVERGIEIVFPSGIGWTLFSKIVAFPAEMPSGLIKRVWLYESPEEKKVSVLLIDDENRKAYRSNANVTWSEWEGLLSLGKHLPRYRFVSTEPKAVTSIFPLSGLAFARGIYLPEESVLVREIHKFYQKTAPNRMVSLLFVDPSITRQLVERDGSIIYTDGSQGMKVSSDGNQMIAQFTEPYRATERVAEPPLGRAVDFVNRYGGWPGNFYLDRTEALDNNRWMMTFRLSVDDYPVYSQQEEWAEIAIETSGQTAVEYRRSLLRLDQDVERQYLQSNTADAILQALKDQEINIEEIADCKLGYRMTMNGDYLVLKPVWAISLKNGRYRFLMAGKGE